uniref:Serine protease 56 n=1 Tax=Sinocyclocheilus grahami TaxID=75366 RepID=A0A672RSM2_SINGR
PQQGRGRLQRVCALSVSGLCEVISRAQQEADEGERSWLLSQACGFYKCHCTPAQVNRDLCIRIMGESCSVRVLQCSLLNTMQNLESLLMQFHWPWLVNLRLDGALMCGGVLVDSSWVLTAAHCFTSQHWTPCSVVGEFDLTKTDPDEQIMKVSRIITHPKFNPKTFNNDIALVELSSPVILSERVTPVCLPSDLDPPAGTPCLVAGWGSLYEGKKICIAHILEKELSNITQCLLKMSALGKELLTNTMFCAGYLSGGIDSCQGDSGGPLIFQDRLSGRFQLFGVTSWGDGCGERGKPGVYTRVTAFSDWVMTEIQSEFLNMLHTHY